MLTTCPGLHSTAERLGFESSLAAVKLINLRFAVLVSAYPGCGHGHGIKQPGDLDL